MTSLFFAFLIGLIGVVVVTGFIWRRYGRLEDSGEKPAALAPEPTPRFEGQRVYSLALRGRHRMVMRVCFVVVSVLPLLVLPVIWRASMLADNGSSLTRVWLFGLFLIVWFVISVWFLRTLWKYRNGMRVVLTGEGVRYLAQGAGLFPRRDVFLPWADIEHVGPLHPRQPRFIAVHGKDRQFTFDRANVRDVSSAGGTGVPGQGQIEHDLYLDLLTHAPGLVFRHSGARRVTL